MRVAIIGAGVAGLATAKVLKQAGHEVVGYEKAPDVGGVWSRTRRYPGLTTQSPKQQYSLSDYPMPRDYPEWPTGRRSRPTSRRTPAISASTRPCAWAPR